MKRFDFFLMSCLFATCMFCAAGCDKEKDNPDNPNDSVPDPIGAIRVTMRNGNNGLTSVTPDNCDEPFCIGRDDNCVGTYNKYKFATIGKVNGLGNVNKIPTSGWAEKVAVLPGYGYVGASMGSNYFQTTRVTYVRMYVVDWITNTSGGIIGAEVQYQSPFSFKLDAKEITVSETVISVPRVGGGYSGLSTPITVSPSNANWSVTSSENWCRVNAIDINAFRINYYNNDTNPIVSRTAILTIKVEGLPDKTITVIQAGS